MTGERATFLGGITVSAAEVFCERYADELGDDADTLRARRGSAPARWAGIDTGMVTLVHGDYRLDNLMFPTQGRRRRRRAVDWQTLTVGAARS